MTWSERIMLLSALSLAITNLAVALWTMLRACQTWRHVTGRK